jgi:hypothetical protein
MRQRVVVGAAAWLEIIVGALFLTVPDVLSYVPHIAAGISA